MWAGRAANKRARSTERVRGSLLKRSSVRKLASFHLLRFAPNSLSFRSSIDGKSIKVVHPPPERVRSEPRRGSRSREEEYSSAPFEIDGFEARAFRSLEFSRKFRGSRDQTSEESLVSHGTLPPPIATSRLSLSRSVLFLSREGEGGGVSGVQRLNDRIPRPSNRVFAGSVCRLSTN